VRRFSQGRRVADGGLKATPNSIQIPQNFNRRVYHVRVITRVKHVAEFRKKIANMRCAEHYREILPEVVCQRDRP
jgi:hypothetical protein